ncbi:MAG: hypothetical protein ABIX28_09725 [Vicinamibacterales bacterium]
MPLVPGSERRVGLPFTLVVCPICDRETISRILLAGEDVFYQCTVCGAVWSHPRRRQAD